MKKKLSVSKRVEKYVEIFAIVNHFQSYNLDFAPQYDVVREN